MKSGSSIILIEILLLVLLASSFFFGFPIPPEVLSKFLVGSLIIACGVLIVIQRLLRR